MIDVDTDGAPAQPKQNLADAAPPMKRANVHAPPPPPPPKRKPEPVIEAPSEREQEEMRQEARRKDDEKAESDMGLSPTLPPAAPKAEKSVQDQLADLVISAGWNFDDFRAWGLSEFKAGDSATGPLAWDAMSGFGDVPERAAKLFIRAKVGMLSGLKQVNGGEA